MSDVDASQELPRRLEVEVDRFMTGVRAACPGMTGTVLQNWRDGQIASGCRNRVKPRNQKYFALPEF
ncbi:hypothetical protein [Bradyrhizobium sp.]|uniref:hypothetical protein n=1 Tax=Bradyrhizobium sp. TaxID=376 RepID=UPI0025B8A039|nr:hypothetical protein [Bradyrhizobium sp.]